MHCRVMVCNHYRVQKAVKQDNVYPIFEGVNIQNNQPVIIKGQSCQSRFSYNGYEGCRMFYQGKVLQTIQGGKGAPSLYWCGQDTDYSCIIMERLGHTLDELLMKCGGRFSTKTVLMVALQTLQILQYFHLKQLVHRSVCPTNFMIGLGKKNSRMYIVDFSTTVKYLTGKNNKHIQQIDRGFNVNNLHYSSVEVNQGRGGGRRDDLISWFYMLVCMAKGGLPWKGLPELDLYKRTSQIQQIKKNTTFKQLCKGLPKGFLQVGQHLQSLKFSQKPHYTFIRAILQDMLSYIGQDFDKVYDWVLLPPIQYPTDYPQKLSLSVKIVPYQEEVLAYEYEQYLKQLSQSKRKKQQRCLVESTNTNANTDQTNQPFNQLKNPKQCRLF